jgi:hypothetical protein
MGCQAQNGFLECDSVHWTEPWVWPGMVAAHRAWSLFIARGPIADIFSGAFALRFDALLTGSARVFQKSLRTRRIETPP